MGLAKEKNKQIAIKLEYRDKTFLSVYESFNKEEEESLIKLIESAASGKVNHLQFKCHNIQQFFSEKILSESILGLVYKTNPFNWRQT
jgi:hypothetical protein